MDLNILIDYEEISIQDWAWGATIFNGGTARYWVGGESGASWSDIENGENQWALTSGGVGGASVPTKDNDVFFDENSGSSYVYTQYENGDPACRTLDLTGFNGVLSGSSVDFSFNLYGSLIFDPVKVNTENFVVSMNAMTSGNIINTQNQYIKYIEFTGFGEWSLESDLLVTEFCEFYGGTFNVGNHNVTAYNFHFDVGGDEAHYPTINMGSGSWNVTGYYEDNEATHTWSSSSALGNASYVQINSESSSIRFTEQGGNTKYLRFYDSGDNVSIKCSYNNVYLESGTLEISGWSSFNDLHANENCTIKFEDNTTTTFSNFSSMGMIGEEITISSMDIFNGYNNGQETEAGTVTVDSSTGTNDWTNPNNVKVFDASYSTVTLSGAELSYKLVISNLGFTIPAEAVVSAVYLHVIAKVNSGDCAIDNAYHRIDGVETETDGAFGSFSAVESTGIAYLGGSELTPDILNGDFAAAINLTRGSANPTIFSVNQMSVLVNYYLPGSHTLFKVGGAVTTDYMNIQHSIATPANTWYAGSNSTDNQANETAGSGWIFDNSSDLIPIYIKSTTTMEDEPSLVTHSVSPKNNNPRRGPQILGSSSKIE